MAAWLNLAVVEAELRTGFVGRRLIYCTSTSSTQDVARSEGEAGAVEGTVVLSEEQTEGRGRMGRSWVSPAGTNLYLTLVMRPTVKQLRSLTIVAPLAVAEAVEEATGRSPAIKWPNDVLIEGRKLAGVLIESELAGQLVKYALVGIGVNVNFEVERVPEIAEIATSLKRELGWEVNREAVLATLLNRFEVLYQEAGRGRSVYEAWRSRLETLGRAVKVTFGGQVEAGVAEDVDEEGKLVLRRADGSRTTIAAGEVTLR